MAPSPYKISIPQSKLDTLKAKLSLTEFPDELEASEWDLGVPLADMKRLTKAWEKWDWRQAEEKLNKIPQYHTGVKVDGFDELDIHFVWQKSEVKDAIPLLFVHGVRIVASLNLFFILRDPTQSTFRCTRPGSFIEVLSILPLLSEPGGPAFHIVAPSLPNFGFSSTIRARGFSIKQYAETCHKLMLSLGYPQYVTQGGDWGFYITRAIGHLYPQSCKASHINMIRANPPTYSKNPLLTLKHNLTPYTSAELTGLQRTAWFNDCGKGYYIQQSTKPQTISYSFTDSPAGLLAWIYEKLHDWTDGYPWSDEEVFTWVSIYWFSRGGAAAAARIYYEVVNTKGGEGNVTREQIMQWIPHVKLGLAHNPRELCVFPRSWCHTLGPVVYETFNESGGHFYATEKPELLARDLRIMFGKGGGAYGVVEGKNGYSKRVEANL